MCGVVKLIQIAPGNLNRGRKEKWRTGERRLRAIPDRAPDGRPVLFASFENGDILLEQIVGDVREGHAFPSCECGKIGLHVGVKIYGQIDPDIRLMELPARAAGKIDFWWNVVAVFWGGCVHGFAYRGSSS
jgi:hypothetical protein